MYAATTAAPVEDWSVPDCMAAADSMQFPHILKTVQMPILAQAFFADIYAEAKRARPSPGHAALASLAAAGKLRRHYTLNIDSLAAAVGLSTWHPEDNPAGVRCSLRPSYVTITTRSALWRC